VPAVGLAATLLIVAALGAGVARGAPEGAPSAGASVASCSGKAFSPTQRGSLLTSRGALSCRGDVARQRLRTCLEQQAGSRFVAVECQTRARSGPGTIRIVVRHRCGRDDARAFRTRSFLFLRDRSGQQDRSSAVSDLRVFPRRCS
jgi:hypothetical protein